MTGRVRALPGVNTHPDAAFVDLYTATATRIYAYARRHADADTAQDVVSDVFLVAWRRRTDLPDDPLPWLLVTARNVLASYWRSRSRQARLAAGLAGVRHLAELSDADPHDRLALASAFGRLSPADRETLLLVGWDGLTPAQAALVVGCSPNTFAARLSRARRRLDALASGEVARPRLAAIAQGETP